jgi:hypothetical protein
MMQRIEEFKEMRDAFVGEFGQSHGLMGLFDKIIESDHEGAIAQSLGKLFGGIAQGIQSPPSIQPPKPEPKLPPGPPQKTEEEQKQESVSRYLNKLLKMSPEEAAMEIYSNRGDDPRDFRALAVEYAVDMPFDELMSLLNEHCPPFLMPILNKADKKWLAALKDELTILKSAETEVNEGENTEELPETPPDAT